MKSFAFAVLFVAILAVNRSVADINLCDGVANGIFLADLNNCSQYLTCYNNITYDARACPDGLLFNAASQSCDPEEEVQCFQCSSALSTYPYDKTCTKYVLCYEGTPVIRECLDNLQYNAATDRCDFPNLVDCQANLCPSNDINNIIFLQSHANCSNYFICYNGVPVLQECSPDLYYNPDRQGCDYKTNVNCTVSATSRRVLSYSKQPPLRASITCPKEGTHFYPNKEDEASYFFCVNGSGVKLSCSPGLVYDETKETCRDPSHVGK